MKRSHFYSDGRYLRKLSTLWRESFKATEERFLTVERITSERFTSAWKLRKRLQDKPKISFTDFTSMAIMEEKGIKNVLTEDEHFMQVGMGFQRVP